MKLSISNIAWDSKYDGQMYESLSKEKIDAVEIAPTRIFAKNPYDRLQDAKSFSDMLKTQYNLEISSMQSIWFGITQNIFEGDESRKFLIQYTKKAIDFARTIGYKNLVFGCPKNRIIPSKDQYIIAVEFFQELGEYAYRNNTVLAIEANPTIYGTNFINNTKEAADIVKDIASPGCLINLDLGTIIENNEDINEVTKYISLINHVHISEPYLAYIKKREIHKELIKLLKAFNYNKYVSVEMKETDSLTDIFNAIYYLKNLCEK